MIYSRDDVGHLALATRQGNLMPSSAGQPTLFFDTQCLSTQPLHHVNDNDDIAVQLCEQGLGTRLWLLRMGGMSCTE